MAAALGAILRRKCPRCRTAWIVPPQEYCGSCRRARDRARGTTAQRGYGAAWQRLRRQILARDPVCTLCGTRPSTEVDHIVPLHRGGLSAPENLRGTCKPCNAGWRGRA